MTPFFPCLRPPHAVISHPLASFPPRTKDFPPANSLVGQCHLCFSVDPSKFFPFEPFLNKPEFLCLTLYAPFFRYFGFTLEGFLVLTAGVFFRPLVEPGIPPNSSLCFLASGYTLGQSLINSSFSTPCLPTSFFVSFRFYLIFFLATIFLNSKLPASAPIL